MKKLLILVTVLVLAILSLGCANQSAVDEPIIGDWELITPAYDDGGNIVEYFASYTFTFREGNSGEYISFNSRTNGLTWQSESDNKYAVVLKDGIMSTDENGQIVPKDTTAEAQIMDDGTLRLLWNGSDCALTKPE